jgi:cysteine desulfurase
MMMHRTYLDHNATAPLRPEAAAAMTAAMSVCGNPSSVHHEGRRARAIIETAREQVAKLVNAKPLEVVFTSGATEANAWVIGAGGWAAIVSAEIEHDSVRGPVSNANGLHRSLAVGTDGLIDLSEIAKYGATAAETGGRTLVVLQMANNETGVLQPVAETAALCRKYNLHLHTDAVQMPGRLPIDFTALGADTLSLSSHKLGGPAGVGALIIRDGAKLASFMTGGGQERRRRAGTENVTGIAGFGAAAEAAGADVDAATRLAGLRDQLEAGLREITPPAVIVGSKSPRLPNTASVALPGRAAETMVIKLDLAGIAVSAGAACSSGKVGASHVLTAMGLGADLASTAIRVSLGWNSSKADVATFLEVWGVVTQPRALRAVA